MFEIWFETRRDFLFPVGRLSKEKNRSDDGWANFPSDLFDSILKICAHTSHEKNWKVKIKFRLPLNQTIKSVSHFAIDVRVLFLFIDNSAFFSSKVHDIGTG